MSLYSQVALALLILISTTFYFSMRKDGLDRQDALENTGVLAFIYVLVAGVVYGGLSFAAFSQEKETISYRSEFTDLIALTDLAENYSESDGYTFLTLGKFESESGTLYKIRYAAKQPNGVIRIATKEMDATNVGFMEDGTNALEVIYEDKMYTPSKWAKLWLGDKESTSAPHVVDTIFHIPADSISTVTEIDLQ